MSSLDSIVDAIQADPDRRSALDRSRFVINMVLHMDVAIIRHHLTRDGSHIHQPTWTAVLKAIISPKNNDFYCFLWAVIVALHYEELGNNPGKISKLRKYTDM